MATVTIKCTADETYTGRRGAVSFADGTAKLDVDVTDPVDRQKTFYFERRDGYEVSGPKGGWKLTEEPEPPNESDPKSDWVDYAVERGANREEAEDATKAELVDTYT